MNVRHRTQTRRLSASPVSGAAHVAEAGATAPPAGAVTQVEPLAQADPGRTMLLVAFYATQTAANGQPVPVAAPGALLLLRLDSPDEGPPRPPTMDDHALAVPAGAQLTLSAADAPLQTLRVTAAVVRGDAPAGVDFQTVTSTFGC